MKNIRRALSSKLLAAFAKRADDGGGGDGDARAFVVGGDTVAPTEEGEEEEEECLFVLEIPETSQARDASPPAAPPAPRRCGIHPDVVLTPHPHGDDDDEEGDFEGGCHKCRARRIQLMRIAAETLQKRASFLESSETDLRDAEGKRRLVDDFRRWSFRREDDSYSDASSEDGSVPWLEVDLWHEGDDERSQPRRRRHRQRQLTQKPKPKQKQKQERLAQKQKQTQKQQTQKQTQKPPRRKSSGGGGGAKKDEGPRRDGEGKSGKGGRACDKKRKESREEEEGSVGSCRGNSMESEGRRSKSGTGERRRSMRVHERRRTGSKEGEDRDESSCRGGGTESKERSRSSTETEERRRSMRVRERRRTGSNEEEDGGESSCRGDSIESKEGTGKSGKGRRVGDTKRKERREEEGGSVGLCRRNSFESEGKRSKSDNKERRRRRKVSERRRTGSKEEEEGVENSCRGGSMESEGRSRSGSRERRTNKRKWKRHLFSLGQRARPCHMEAPSSSEDALIKIARLQNGDGAWVRRNKGGGGRGKGKGKGDGRAWTYAILKKRREDSLVFIVSERGATKECSIRYWTKFVRVVAPEYALKEEEEDQQDVLDAFVRRGGGEAALADLPSNSRCISTTKTGRHKDPSGEADVTAGANETYRRADSSCGRIEPASGRAASSLVPDHGMSMNTLGSVVPDHDMSMNTLGSLVPDHNMSMYSLCSEGDAPPAVVLQDHENSTYTLVSNGIDEDSISLEDDIFLSDDQEPDNHSIEPSREAEVEAGDNSSIESMTGRIKSSVGHTKPPSRRAKSSTGEEKLLPNHDVSMFTLVSEGEKPPAVVLRDHESSMYTLVGNRVDEDEVLDDHNISVPENDHDISMYTFSHGKRAAKADGINLVRVDRRADYEIKSRSSHDQIPKKTSKNRRNTSPTSISDFSEEESGNPPEGERRRRPKDPPASVPSGRSRHATDRLTDGNTPNDVSATSLSLTSAAGRSLGKKSRRKTQKVTTDHATKNDDKAKKKRAGGQLSKSLPVDTSPTPISVESRRAVGQLSQSLPLASESSEEETGTWADSPGKGRPKEVPPPKATSRSGGEGGDAKKARSVQRGHNVPTHAGGPIVTKKKKRRASQKSSKSLLAAGLPTPISESHDEATGTWEESPRKGRPEELAPPPATRRSNGDGGKVKLKKDRAVQRGHDVPTSVDGLVDTKKNRKKPSPQATGAQQLSKSLPPTKLLPISESRKDRISTGLDCSRKKPTKETTQPVDTTTPNIEADFSSSTMTATSINSIFGPYLAKDHAEHKSAHDDANKGKNDTSSRNAGKVSATMKDHDVSTKPFYSSNNASGLAKENETIAGHQQSLHDDEEETNTLNIDSDRSSNNGASGIADFQQTCNSMQRSNSIRSESYGRQKRKPKRGNLSRRVSWSGKLEERYSKYADVGSSSVSLFSVSACDRAERRAQRSKSLSSSSLSSVPSTCCSIDHQVSWNLEPIARRWLQNCEID